MYLFWESTQKARKEHFCDYCFTAIMPGETYHRQAWVPARGKLFVLRRHYYPSECAEDVYVEVPQEQSVAFSFAVRLEAVRRVLVGGKTVTEFEPRLVLVGGTENDDPLGDYADDDDIPF